MRADQAIMAKLAHSAKTGSIEIVKKTNII
jgi:hypothetical protein